MKKSKNSLKHPESLKGIPERSIKSMQKIRRMLGKIEIYKKSTKVLNIPEISEKFQNS